MIKLKKSLSIILTAILIVLSMPNGLFGLNANATSGTTGDCAWFLEGTVLTISGNGAMKNFDRWNLPSWTNKIVSKIIIEYGVTSIGDYAFFDCVNLTDISIPKSVTYIGESAFYNCNNLAHIIIPNSVISIANKAFRECGSLSNIIIPDSVTNIGDEAFWGCKNLSSITMPKSIAIINEKTFVECVNLTNVIIPDSVTSIGDSAFSCCYNLTNLIIGNGVTNIGSGSFFCCKNLTNIIVPMSVTIIGQEAFKECSALRKITLTNHLKKVENQAFAGCKLLDYLTFIGTKDEWLDIAFGTGNTDLVYCPYKNFHTHYFEWVIDKSATCVENGVKHKYCKECGTILNEGTIIPINENHKLNKGEIVSKPTCTQSGKIIYKCTVCSKNVKTEEISPLGHDIANQKVTKQPTCTESGIETGKCTRCGQETTNTIKPTGHKFGVWEDVKKATCTEGGTQKRVCSKCNAEETRITDALGHDFDNPTVVKEATISSTGLMEGKCKRCGEATQEVIPCTAKDDNTGIEFEANEGVFAEGTQMMVEEIKQDNPTYESVKNILSGISDTFTVYDISAVLNGAEVQPNGEVVVTFNIPEGYGTDVAVFYIFDEGTYEKLESIVSEDGKTISVKLNHFSNYAVCKLGTSNSANTDTIDKPVEQPTESNNTLWIIIAIVAVILIAGVATALILVKKKKTDNPDDSGMFL